MDGKQYILAFAVVLAVARSAKSDSAVGQYVISLAHPASAFACTQSAITATTQCQGAPAAGTSLYLQDFAISDGTGALGLNFVTGTGTNCATNQTNVTPVFNLGINGNTWMDLQSPIKLPTGQALCCKTGGATAFSCLASGYSGP